MDKGAFSVWLPARSGRKVALASSCLGSPRPGGLPVA